VLERSPADAPVRSAPDGVRVEVLPSGLTVLLRGLHVEAIVPAGAQWAGTGVFPATGPRDALERRVTFDQREQVAGLRTLD
jgi:hypothetical protein